MINSAQSAVKGWLTLIRDNHMRTVRRALHKLLMAGSMALVFGIIFLMVPFSLEAEESVYTGLIQGQVTNRTLDTKGETGLEVFLYLHAGNQGLELARTNTGAEGSFSFPDQDMAKKRLYYVLANYKGIGYFSRVGAFDDSKTADGNKSLVLDLNIAEITDKDDDIGISMHHVLMEMDVDVLLFKELMVVENRGTRTYVGRPGSVEGKNTTIHISLPEGAGNVQYLQGLTSASTVQSKTGLVDTVPIKPGMKRIQFTYSIDTKGKDYKFLKAFNLKTKQFGVIFPESGLEVSSEQLSLEGPMDTQGKKFYTLSGKNFPRGLQIAVNIKGAEKGSIVKWGVVVLGVIILGVGIGIPLKMKKVTQDEEPENDRYESRTDVLQAVAELDDQAETGEIDTEEYKVKRAELLSRAKELS